MSLRIITIKGVLIEKEVDAIQVKLPDGLIVINKNYAAVTERLVGGNAVVINGESRTKINISDGWLVMNNNRCDLFVSAVTE